jgi:hypothetical protein
MRPPQDSRTYRKVKVKYRHIGVRTPGEENLGVKDSKESVRLPNINAFHELMAEYSRDQQKKIDALSHRL